MRNILIFFFIGCNLNLNAQKNLSLTESIAYCLKHHPSIVINENNIAIATARSRQAVSAYLPQVSGSSTFLDNLKLQTTIIPAGIFGPTSKDVQFGTQYSTVLSLDASQTIYDQSKLTGIKANKPYLELTELQKQQNQENIIYNTAVAYFQVLIFQEQIKNLNENKQKYQALLDILNNQLKNGFILERDVDRINVALNSTNYQIEDASNKEKLAINTLKNAIGMPLEDSLLVTDTINYENYAIAQPKDSLSLNSLVDVKLSQANIALEKINVQSKKDAFIPTLSAVGKLATQSLNNNFSDAFSSWNNFSYVGLSLNIPIFSGFRRESMLNEEKLNLRNYFQNFEVTKENLKLKYENAKTSVGSAYAAFKTNKDNLELAKKVLDVTNYQYQKGVAALSDYLNDDSAYKTAQSNYLNSLYNLVISQLNYQKSNGTMLQKGSILISN